jgi:dihydroorotate dehydrogenase electron transfer subunit
VQTRLHDVVRVRPLSGGSAALEVAGPVPETLPGQFYMLRTAERWPVLLPRPFSLYDRDAARDGGAFLIKPVGPGTRALCALRAGERVWATGPLGQPFPLEVADPVCVAGGVGLAPFLLLARRQRALGRPPLRLLFGGRTRDALAGREDFAGLARTWLATDDGSEGARGFVSVLLEQRVAAGDVRGGDVVFCCGPDPMMHAVAAVCARLGLRCFLSLETTMACGYGVCNGCSVRVRGARFGNWPYSRCCQQGPVYEAAELADYG